MRLQYPIVSFLKNEYAVSLAKFVLECFTVLRNPTQQIFPSNRVQYYAIFFHIPTSSLVVLGTGGAGYLTSNQLYFECSAVLVIATGCAEYLSESTLR